MISTIYDNQPIKKGSSIMMKHVDHFHGSDLEKIEQVYGIKKEDIISFSANVNPLGVSFLLRDSLSHKIDAITSYPDREYKSLRQCIAKYVHTSMENIIVGNGSTELISLFIQIKKPKKALMLGPTYSEYEREVALGGGRSHYYNLDETKDFALDMEELRRELQTGVDLFVICNPNNPTSSVITQSEMRHLLDICKQRDIMVLVDETYVEFTEHMDSITSVPLAEYYNNLIILRGTSKFFAAPGLRLGYAICGNNDLRAEISKRQNPWTINSLAAIAGEIMFTDTEYMERTKNLIHSERKRCLKRLKESNYFKVYPSHANFVLLKIKGEKVTSQDLFDATIREGLMIRDCSTFPFLDNHYIRFCFMNPEDNDHLIDVMIEQMKTNTNNN